MVKWAFGIIYHLHVARPLQIFVSHRTTQCCIILWLDVFDCEQHFVHLASPTWHWVFLVVYETFCHRHPSMIWQCGCWVVSCCYHHSFSSNNPPWYGGDCYVTKITNCFKILLQTPLMELSLMLVLGFMVGIVMLLTLQLFMQICSKLPLGNCVFFFCLVSRQD